VDADSFPRIRGFEIAVFSLQLSQIEYIYPRIDLTGLFFLLVLRFVFFPPGSLSMLIFYALSRELTVCGITNNDTLNDVSEMNYLRNLAGFKVFGENTT
jgi:hypothetical protein